MKNQASCLDTTTHQAVLTGDLVASRTYGARAVDDAMRFLSTTADDIAGWHLTETMAVQDTRFTRYRGDGWQMIVSIAHFGLRAAIFAYARLAARPELPETRIAVGIGTVDRLPGPDLSAADGPAFAVSGHTLGRMARGERLKLAGHGVNECWSALTRLLDDRLQDWTPEQAEAVALAIVPGAPTQAELATRLGISPQAVSSRLTGARWPSIRHVLAEWERPELPGRAAP